MTTNTYLAIITLNVNGLNAPIKKTQSGRLDKNTRAYNICCLQETHLKAKDTYKLKVRGWKKIFHMNGKDMKAVLATLKTDKMDF